MSKVRILVLSLDSHGDSEGLRFVSGSHEDFLVCFFRILLVDSLIVNVNSQ